MPTLSDSDSYRLQKLLLSLGDNDRDVLYSQEKGFRLFRLNPLAGLSEENYTTVISLITLTDV